ncbi:hypothetical protein JB92DRAFT_461722 [Gautieria morchelliformis]|nr:hypothetical protein JB92DRAFT_461722 [Gautieria morchelliformis]
MVQNYTNSGNPRPLSGTGCHASLEITVPLYLESTYLILVCTMSVTPQSFVTMAKSDITLTEYSALASLVVLLYDHAITFDAEIMNIWRGPRTLGKLMFLWTRYFGLSSLIIVVTVTFHGSLPNKVCSAVFWLESVSILIAIVSVDIILLARVYAVYNRNKQLLCGMVGFQLITTAAIVVLFMFYMSAGVGLPSVDNLTGCFNPSASRNLAVFLVPSLANEVVLCLLMLYKQWDRHRNELGSSQLKRLVQDSINYFFCILAVHLTNLLVFYLAPRGLILIAIGWEFTIPCTMGCRLLLNMFNHYGSASGQDTTLPQSRQDASYLLSESDVRMQSLSSQDVEPPVVAVKECIGR